MGRKSNHVYTDKRILGLSFGSKLGGVVRHCYPLNDNPRNPYCKGVEGLLDGYKATLNNGNLPSRDESLMYHFSFSW